MNKVNSTITILICTSLLALNFAIAVFVYASTASADEATPGLICPHWGRDTRRYMDTRAVDEPYSRDSLREAFRLFDLNLNDAHIRTIYWDGVRVIAEVMRRVEFKAMSKKSEDK